MNESVGTCPQCGNGLKLENTYPPLVCLQLPRGDIKDVQAHLRVDYIITAGQRVYTLRGVIYWGESEGHFVCRLIDDIGRVYSYDDMKGGGAVAYEGLINPAAPIAPAWLSTMGSKVASLAFYVQSDLSSCESDEAEEP